MAGHRSVPRGGRDHEVVGWLFFAGATLLSFFALSFDAVSAPVGRTGLWTVSAATLACAVGSVAYLGIAAARGLLSVGWPGLLFPTAFWAFHFGSFGGVARGWYRPALFPTAWSLAALCLLAWMFGYLVARGRTRVRLRPAARHGRVLLSRADLDRIAYLGTALTALGVGLSFAAFVAVGFWDLMLSDYMRSRALLSPELGGRPAYVFAIAKLVVVVGVTVVTAAGAIGRGRVLHNRLFAVLLAVDLLVLLHLGDRSEFSMVLFPVLLFHHAYVRPFTWRSAVVLGGGLLAVFAVIKVVRATRSIEAFTDFYGETGVVESVLDEMGYTLDTVVRSLAVVPDDQPFFRGKTYLHAVARALPNVTFTPRTWGFVSSQWINWETAPELARRGNALGFSIVAEAYINFGLVGAAVVHAAIGAFHGRLERAMTGAVVSPWGAMAFALLTVCLLMHVRNTVVLYIRLGLWMLAILAAVWVAFSLLRALRIDLRPT